MDRISSHVANEEEESTVEIKFCTVSSKRLKSFSDAVWSIIATIMIVPTMHAHISEQIKTHHDMSEIVKRILPQVLLYFLAFLIICSTWACHVWTFQTARKVTDLSIMFNLIVLMAASFLPFSYSLMSRFRTWQTVIIYCCVQISIGIFQLIIVFHAFSYPKILSVKIEEQPEEKKSKTRWTIVCHIVVAPSFALIAIFISSASPNAAIVCLAMILVYPWMQSLIVCLLSRFRKCANILGTKRKELERNVLLTERIKKERVEAFSDGVFAITSTLLVLDITEKYLPTKKQVADVYGGNVMDALTYNWGVFLSYTLTFLIIGLVWFTHLTLFKNLEKISRLMLFANNWMLACVGMIPLAFTFILHYHITSALRTGLQFGCVALFLSGFFTILVYLIGLSFARCKKDEDWMSKSIQPYGKDFGIMLFQLLTSPIGSSLVFGLTFLRNEYIAAYLGAALVVLYAITLVAWKSIKATCFKDDADSRGRYTVMKAAESTLDEAGTVED